MRPFNTLGSPPGMEREGKAAGSQKCTFLTDPLRPIPFREKGLANSRLARGPGKVLCHSSHPLESTRATQTLPAPHLPPCEAPVLLYACPLICSYCYSDQILPAEIVEVRDETQGRLKVEGVRSRKGVISGSSV